MSNNKPEFRCKLAHNDDIKFLSRFNSIKELYKRISETFGVQIDQILFCTLNTHNLDDMSSLLANYLTFGDLIVAHICGRGRDVCVKKTQEFLGLTITDNGHGRAFIKKVKSDDKLIEEAIKIGDHIAVINSDSTIGWRHFEVANALREIPEGVNFTMHLIEPLSCARYRMKDVDYSKENSSPIKFEQSTRSNSVPTTTDASTNLDRLSQNSNYTDEDLINSSLPIDRLLFKGTGRISLENEDETTRENGHNLYRTTIERLNTILESSIGTSDNALAIHIYRLAKENKESFSYFTKALRESELSVFNFGDDIEISLWNCATSCASV